MRGKNYSFLLLSIAASLLIGGFLNPTYANSDLIIRLPPGWESLELFTPTLSRAPDDRDSKILGVFNKRDMWYIVKVYQNGKEIMPWNLPYLPPYSAKSFKYTLQAGDQITIEVANDLNDNTLATLWGFDFISRAILGVSVTPISEEFLIELVEFMTMFLTPHEEFLGLGAYLTTGDYEEAVIKIASIIVKSEVVQELFVKILAEAGIKTTIAKVVAQASAVAVSFGVNIPIWWDLWRNTTKDPFIERVVFSVVAKPSIPKIEVEDADNVWEIAMESPSSGLVDAASNVAARTVVEYVDSVQHSLLNVPSPALFTAVSSVIPRIIVEYADSTSFMALSRPSIVPPPSETVVKVDPEKEKITFIQGEIEQQDIKVNLKIEKVKDLAGFQMDLKFDPKIMEAKEVGEGTFLKSAGGATFCQKPVIDNTNGVASISCARITQGGVNGDGLLAEVVFKPREIGESTIEFQNLKLSDSKAEEILVRRAISGKVTIIEGYPEWPAWDVNQDGKVDISDLVVIGQNFGGAGKGDANGDGKVDILDLILVGKHLGEKYEVEAPVATFDWQKQGIYYSKYLPVLTALYRELEKAPYTSPDFEKTRQLLQELIEIAGGQIIPKENMLYQNYPNPFNPDTWIPYQLAEDADVVIRIYTSAGRLVRILNLERKEAGFYTTKDKAAYWDGRNEAGEQVASGVYFYTIQAGHFTATRKMILVK